MATKVRAGCVKTALRRATAHGRDDERVTGVAMRAGCSPRTIYRILGYTDDKPIPLEQADRLLLAAGGHLGVDCMDEEDYEDA